MKLMPPYLALLPVRANRVAVIQHDENPQLLAPSSRTETLHSLSPNHIAPSRDRQFLVRPNSWIQRAVSNSNDHRQQMALERPNRGISVVNGVQFTYFQYFLAKQSGKLALHIILATDPRKLLVKFTYILEEIGRYLRTARCPGKLSEI
jgi:hypothetical protein